jgi:hypothetical protein
MHIKPLIRLFLSGVLLCHAGCAAVRTAPELPLLPDPAAYVQAALTVPPRAALSGIARIAVKAENISRSYKTVFACSYPDALRLEVLGLFNQPGLYISANTDTGISLCVPSENAWYRGPATPGSMQRISGILMDPFDIVRTLHGRPPGPDPSTARISCTQDNDSYACTLTHGETVQQVWINPIVGRVTRSLLFEQGLAVHDIRYQGFREQDGRLIPETIQVLFDRYATSLEIRLQDTLTDPIEPGQLALQAPDQTLFMPLHTFWDRN